MAIIGKFYDEKTHTDKVWYDSSNVFYSKFIENENDNNGQLYVTFKNGATYLYKDVDMVTDYLLFKSGGIDNSQGKALNKQIKGKYEYERVEDENINLLLEELDKCLKEVNTLNNVGKLIEFLKKYPEEQKIRLKVYKPEIDEPIIGKFATDDFENEGDSLYLKILIL